MHFKIQCTQDKSAGYRAAFDFLQFESRILDSTNTRYCAKNLRVHIFPLKIKIKTRLSDCRKWAVAIEATKSRKITASHHMTPRANDTNTHSYKQILHTYKILWTKLCSSGNSFHIEPLIFIQINFLSACC